MIVQRCKKRHILYDSYFLNTRTDVITHPYDSPPKQGSFLCPASNRFHVLHSCADWSQNMRPNRWGRNRLMIYTFCGTSWRSRPDSQPASQPGRQEILILKLAGGGDPSLSVWQSSGIRIIHMAVLLMTIYGLVLASHNLQSFSAPSEKCIHGQRRSTLGRNKVISMFGISTFRDHIF